MGRETYAAPLALSSAEKRLAHARELARSVTKWRARAAFGNVGAPALAL
jgi:hypothetical protein